MTNNRGRFKVGHLYQYLLEESVRIICYTDDSEVTTSARIGKSGKHSIFVEMAGSMIMVVASNHDSPGDASHYKVVMNDGTMGWINLTYLGRQNFIEVKGD